MNDDDRKFVDTHDAAPGGVWLVEVFHKDAFIAHGVFSKFDLAKAWMGGQPSEYACLCAPFVVDHPDFGNVRKEERH